MAISPRLKRQFFIDIGVILIIIVGVVIFMFVSTRNLPGWDIDGDSESLTDEERVVESNIYIRGDGKLALENSTLVIDSSTHTEFGIYLNGVSKLELKDSKIEAADFQYFILSDALEGKSPEITVERSTITDHAGIYLHDRTKFTGVGSTIEEIHLRDDVNVDLEESAVYPVLFTEKSNEFANLTAGDSITLDLESDDGWTLDMNDCEVWGYQIELFNENEVELMNSSDIVLSMHSPGNLDEAVSMEFPFVGDVSSGELSNLGFDLSWTDTGIDMVNLYTIEDDELIVSKGILNEVEATDDASLEINDAIVHCNVCSVNKGATMKFSGVTVVVDEDQEPVLFVYGLSRVEIENSDIRELKIVMTESASVIITDSLYDEEMIENDGDGELEFIESDESISE